MLSGGVTPVGSLETVRRQAKRSAGYQSLLCGGVRPIGAVYYDSCACAAGRDHLAALNVRGRDASPICCLASRCWTCDCGRSAMHRSRADPGYWDTAGYCRILRDTAGYWPSLMRILGYSAGLEDQVAPSIAVLLLGI